MKNSFEVLCVVSLFTFAITAEELQKETKADTISVEQPDESFPMQALEQPEKLFVFHQKFNFLRHFV